MIPMRNPEGHTLSFRTPRIETNPSDPDWFASVTRGFSLRSGYLSIKPNHPERTLKVMVTANQNNGKAIRKYRGLYAAFIKELFGE
jgi:hypothetical protein